MTRQTTKILNRDFVLTLSAQFTVSFVYYILIPTLPIYLSKIGSTEVEIGILIGMLNLSSLVLRPFVGRALVKIPEVTFMIAGAILFALASVGYLFVLPFWPLLTVRMLHGIGLAFFWTASVTLIANVSPEAHLGQSVSYYFMAGNIAFVLAPSFGMFLINSFNFNLLFLFCTGLSLFSLLIITRLGRRQTDPLEKPTIKDGPLLSRKALSPAIVAFMADMAWGAVTAFFPLYAVKHGMANPGLFFGTFAITTVVGRALGGRIFDLPNREGVILPCLTIYIIAMSILFFFKTLPMFLVAAVIWGVGQAFLFPVLTAYTLDLTPASRGPAMGTFMALDDFGIGLGPVIMGIVLSLTSYPVMFLCLGFTGLINIIYFYFFERKKKRVDMPVNESHFVK